MSRRDPRITLTTRWAYALLLALVAGNAAAVEPSRGMLGLIPTDQNGLVIVKDLYVGGPADAAGLWPGDRIIAVDEKTVKTAAELVETLARYEPDTQIELFASRSGWTKQIPIKMGKRDAVSRLPLVSAQQPAPPAQAQTRTPRATTGNSTTINRFRAHEDVFERKRRERW
jgi:predicted metalloprotease with PDZ domain